MIGLETGSEGKDNVTTTRGGRGMLNLGRALSRGSEMAGSLRMLGATTKEGNVKEVSRFAILNAREQNKTQLCAPSSGLHSCQ